MTVSTMTPVVSSQIAAMGHDPVGMSMKVRFNNGSTYSYQGVSKELFAQLLDSESVGSAFSKLIKKNPTAHPYVRVV